MSHLREFERLHSLAAAQITAQEEKHDPQVQAQKRQRVEEEQLRNKTEDMTAADAIQRILLADRDRDYFRMLSLTPPDIDALGRPKWDVSSGEISRAYRKLSVLVHPDKNPGDDARQAFEALNKVHRMLKDPGEIETILKDHLNKAKARKEAEEAKATFEERVLLNARHVEEVKALRRKETEALNAEIVRQMKEKQFKARRKREAETTSQYRKHLNVDNTVVEAETGGHGEDNELTDLLLSNTKGKNHYQQEYDDYDDDGGKEEDGAILRRQALAKRRQQQVKRKTGL